MASTTIAPGTANLSSYSSRRVMIEVTGGSQRGQMRMGTYMMTVPYRCLSQTIQGIHRSGGKVTRVMMSQSPVQDAQSESSPSFSTVANHTPLPQEPEVVPLPKAQESKQAANSRQSSKPAKGKGQRSKRKNKS
jgi:hypothetical protein